MVVHVAMHMMVRTRHGDAADRSGEQRGEYERTDH
jgi:hypothetical protein